MAIGHALQRHNTKSLHYLILSIMTTLNILAKKLTNYSQGRTCRGVAPPSAPLVNIWWCFRSGIEWKYYERINTTITQTHTQNWGNDDKSNFHIIFRSNRRAWKLSEATKYRFTLELLGRFWKFWMLPQSVAHWFII